MSSKVSSCPERETIVRLSLSSDSSAWLGGALSRFQTAPMMIGRFVSPFSKAMTTSSPTSGKKWMPRPSPAIGTITRAGALSCPGSPIPR